jgi:hypothetical protein
MFYIFLSVILIVLSITIAPKTWYDGDKLQFFGNHKQFAGYEPVFAGSSFLLSLFPFINLLCIYFLFMSILMQPFVKSRDTRWIRWEISRLVMLCWSFPLMYLFFGSK